MSYQLNFHELVPYLPELGQGLLVTLELTLYATVGGILLGTLGATARVSRSRPIRLFAGIYVELIRNTPFIVIVQLFFIFFGLPAAGIKLTAWQAGLIAMVVNLGAYSAEILRAGIDATPKGQWEAGWTLGLTRFQIFTRIVLPPAFQRIYSSLVGQCIIVMLGSSVISQISVEELTFSANFIQSRSFLSFESYLLTALLYLILAVFMRLGFGLLAGYVFRSQSR